MLNNRKSKDTQQRGSGPEAPIHDRPPDAQVRPKVPDRLHRAIGNRVGYRLRRSRRALRFFEPILRRRRGLAIVVSLLSQSEVGLKYPVQRPASSKAHSRASGPEEHKASTPDQA